MAWAFHSDVRSTSHRDLPDLILQSAICNCPFVSVELRKGALISKKDQAGVRVANWSKGQRFASRGRLSSGRNLATESTRACEPLGRARQDTSPITVEPVMNHMSARSHGVRQEI